MPTLGTNQIGAELSAKAALAERGGRDGREPTLTLELRCALASVPERVDAVNATRCESHPIHFGR